MIRNRYAFPLLTSFLLFSMLLSKLVQAEEPPTPQEVLEKTCALYSDNWQGLRYHYPGGKSQFLKKCTTAIQGKDLVDGLWAIRSLMPDGHADFEIRNTTKNPGRIYPLVLVYDGMVRKLRVEASFDPALKAYVGKAIEKVNGKPFMDVLLQRALLEPQSTCTSSLEIAARTLTSTLQGKPYLDFPETLELVFEDGSSMNFLPKDIAPLRKANKFILSSNSYPSLWGATGISQENGYCISGEEIAKVINFEGKKWLWWHPRGFHLKDQVEDVFSCWENAIQEAEGVVLDFRDTSGGNLKQVAVMAHQFNLKLPSKMKHVHSDGEVSVSDCTESEGIVGHKTKDGCLQEDKVRTPSIAKLVTQWKGNVVVITNGLCGSSCDMMVYYLQSRKNTCSYGTPTAGRLIGTDEFHPIPPKSGIHVDLDVPVNEFLKPDGNRWEGHSVIPQHLGSGGVEDALRVCSSHITTNKRTSIERP